MQENNTKRVVYVVDGARTPFLKARNKPGAFTASDLAVSASRSLLTRMNASVLYRPGFWIH